MLSYTGGLGQNFKLAGESVSLKHGAWKDLPVGWALDIASVDYGHV